VTGSPLKIWSSSRRPSGGQQTLTLSSDTWKIDYRIRTVVDRIVAKPKAIEVRLLLCDADRVSPDGTTHQFVPHTDLPQQIIL
jgi:hypothetical protein